jgi:alpha-D-xyloside xylohydrolase
MGGKPTNNAIVKWCLLCQGFLLTLTPASWAQGNSVVAWQAQASPFQLSFYQGDRQLTNQSIGSAGPGSRLSYRLNDGTSHSLTNLIGTETIANGTAYSVATDEPNRTARVAVTQTQRGTRVEWTFSRSDDIAQVFEAFSANLSEHFLGTGARAQYVDLQRKVTPLKVHFVDATLSGECNETYLPMPFFFSNAGYGIYLDTPNIDRLASVRGDLSPWERHKLDISRNSKG